MKTYLLLFSLCLSFSSFSQNEHLVDSLVKELGITEMTSIVENRDTSYINEIKSFNEKGLEIEKFSQSYDGIHLHRTEYDSLGRRVSFIIFNKKDTTKIDSKRTWVYIDSNEYLVRRHNSRNELHQTNENKIIEEENALWIYETEIDHPSERRRKKISKYTTYGDTLQISEYVDFDKEGKMEDITCYYRKITINSTLEQRVLTEGTCSPIVPEQDPQLATMEDYKDFFVNLEKYLKKQLNGDYEYELNDDVHTYKVYNFENHLIQDGYGIFSMKTFDYNLEGQLTKTTHWGAPIDDHGIVETGESFYSYYDNGLPKSIETRKIQKGFSEGLRFEYR